MKWLAITLNALVLAGISFFTVANGGPRGGELFPLLIALCVPVVNTAALLMAPATPASDPGFVRLYFKRRALEEQAKINALRTSSK